MERLIDLAKRGNEQARNALISRCIPLINKITFDSLAPYIEAQDLRQELILCFIKIIDKYDKTKGPFWPFVKNGLKLYRLSYLRYESRRIVHDEVIPEVRTTKDWTEAYRLISVLPENQAQTLSRLLSGETTSEIAKGMGLSRKRIENFRREGIENIKRISLEECNV